MNDPDRARVVAPALVLGAHHTVQVAYYDLGRDAVDYQGLDGPVWDGTWSLVLATSNDGGDHFGPGAVVDDEVAPFERVMLVFTMPPPALVTDGNLTCMAWADARYGEADALARCSTDGGRRWGNVRRLNDDRVGNGARQYLPRLGLSPDGRLDAIFYDRRDDPRNLAAQLYYTYSTDGGRSYARNVRISGADIDPRIGQHYSNVSATDQVEFGSRLGLWSGSSTALLAWTDTSNSKTLTPGQDVFTVRVALGRVQPTWARLAGAALIVVGLLCLAAVVRHHRLAARS